MSILEIILLLAGIAACTASFFIPDRKSSGDGTFIDEEAILADIDDRAEEASRRFEDMADETVTYQMEKTERAVDKLTNEKILAIGDYSDKVMDEINKNRNEVVFLSDMLNKNKKELTNLLLRAVETSRTATESANAAYDLAENAGRLAESSMERVREAESRAGVAEERLLDAKKRLVESGAETVKPARSRSKAKEEDGEISDTPLKKSSPRKKKQLPKDDVLEKQLSILDMQDVAAVPLQENVPDEVDKEVKVSSDGDKQDAADVVHETAAMPKSKAAEELFKKASAAMRFDPTGDKKGNNNERILAMHKLGRSNMAIARELGLGVGEVKLVIDLFENMQ